MDLLTYLLLIGMVMVQLHRFAPLKPGGADWRVTKLIRKEITIFDEKILEDTGNTWSPVFFFHSQILDIYV